MPDNYTKKLSGIFYILQYLEYGHLPDETYRYPVRSVVRLSQCFGPGSKVVATSYVCYEEVQIGFHRIEFDTGEISPRGAVIPFFHSFGGFSDRCGLIHPFHESVPFRQKTVVAFGYNGEITGVEDVMSALMSDNTRDDSLAVDIFFRIHEIYKGRSTYPDSVHCLWHNNTYYDFWLHS